VIALALLLALASAAALNWSYLVQHGEAASMPPLSVRRPLRSLRLLFSNVRWLVGFLTGIGGWVLYVAALALAPLSLVQAVSAGGIGLLALFVWRLTGVKLRRREWIGVAVAVGGLALLAGSLGGGHTHGVHGAWVGIAVWLACSVGLAGLAVVAPGLAPGAGLGAAAGLMYAAGDVATKAATGGGARLAFVPVLLACHGLAFVCLQLGFQRGSALATAGVATLLTNAVPIAAGVALYHEHLPHGALGALRALAFAAVVVGAAALARGEAEPAASPG
jgi:drug/metabolite transporter (DMT)-like permease